VILLTLELAQLDLGDALSDASLLSEELAAAPVSVEEGTSWSGGILRLAPAYFVIALPFGFSGIPGILYTMLLLGSLAFLASRLAPAASVWGIVVFVMLATAHVAAAWSWGIPPARLALLVDNFSIYDTLWIFPQLLLAMHLMTILLFGVFPLFYLLPEKVRPKRNELFAVWFFCWWFMMSVLVFQGRFDLTVRLPGLLGALALTAFASVWMPLGRLWMYQFAKVTGFSRLMPAFGSGGDGVSFTDAKLQEAQAASRLEAEEFAGVIEIGRRLFTSHDQAAFPGMWLSLIRAHIEQEDIYEGEKLLKEFQARFGNSSRADEGTLLESLYKSVTGDFAGALKAINMIPDDRARKFAGDEAALSLLVIGRCNVFFNQAIQAHIDWTRALDHARLPLVRAYILVELALQDASMNRREWTDKWVAFATHLSVHSR
ncbi:MAG TPA: hypothetical protein PKM25_19045, partial [Candidatus Ozemobacteraceae bacterium]|nr:hypothetical protein [Candidatus Ozemobacteraceae bacterium]